MSIGRVFDNGGFIGITKGYFEKESLSYQSGIWSMESVYEGVLSIPNPIEFVGGIVGQSSTDITSFNISSLNIQQGDLMFLVTAQNTNANVNSVITGVSLTKFIDYTTSSYGNGEYFYGYLNGNETTITVDNNSLSNPTSVAIFRNAEFGGVEGTDFAYVTGSGVNPPALAGFNTTTPFNDIAIAATTVNVYDNSVTPVAPAGYITAAAARVYDGANLGGASCIGYKAAETSSEDPGSFTLGETSGQWSAATIKITAR